MTSSTPLPSRERLAGWLESSIQATGLPRPIVRAYVEGRLVDREAMTEERSKFDEGRYRRWMTDWEEWPLMQVPDV